MKHTTKALVCLLLAVLLAAAALTGCAQNNNGSAEPSKPAQSSAAPSASAPAETSAAPAESAAAPAASGAPVELGEGEKLFYFNVSFSSGETASYAIRTDAETVGEALLEQKLIEGETADYGMYVTTVCGETLSWDADKMYWAFYENGEYAVNGVDSTAVSDGATYAFEATKG